MTTQAPTPHPLTSVLDRTGRPHPMSTPAPPTLDAFPVTTRRRGLRRARTASTRLQPGPTGPQPGITAPSITPALATYPVTAGGLFVVGAHGGAGETTIASWTGGRAAGRRWPVSATWATPGNHPRPDGRAIDLVLVARTHARGLAAAREVLTQWAAGRLPANQLRGLVLIPDAPGRLPPQLAEQGPCAEFGARRDYGKCDGDHPSDPPCVHPLIVAGPSRLTTTSSRPSPRRDAKLWRRCPNTAVYRDTVTLEPRPGAAQARSVR